MMKLQSPNDQLFIVSCLLFLVCVCVHFKETAESDREVKEGSFSPKADLKPHEL